MLRSLEKLKSRDFAESITYTPSAPGNIQEILIDIADEIQSELDLYYIARPLFEDGAPVQFGDEFKSMLGKVERLTEFSIDRDGMYALNPYCTSFGLILDQGDRAARPKDTQERIESDADALADKLADMTADSARAAITWLLVRQRKVDADTFATWSGAYE